MLIKVKNKEYYQKRIQYYERLGYRGYEARTFAFFDTQNNLRG